MLACSMFIRKYISMTRGDLKPIFSRPVSQLSMWNSCYFIFRSVILQYSMSYDLPFQREKFFISYQRLIIITRLFHNSAYVIYSLKISLSEIFKILFRPTLFLSKILLFLSTSSSYPSPRVCFYCIIVSEITVILDQYGRKGSRSTPALPHRGRHSDRGDKALKIRSGGGVGRPQASRLIREMVWIRPSPSCPYLGASKETHAVYRGAD